MEIILNENLCHLLRASVKRLLERERNRLEKYRGIRDSGEATDHQMDLFFFYEDNVDDLQRLDNAIKKMSEPF